jgi:RecA-family ATPase
VVLLGHPSLPGLNSGSGTSGSTAWNNSVRSRLYLSRIVQDGYEPDPNKRVLGVKKLNFGPTGGEIAMTWQDGVFVVDQSETDLDRFAASAKAERVFLKLLRLFTEQGRTVNHVSSPNYAIKLFEGHREAEGMTKRALKPAMEALQSGRIRIETMGPPSKPVRHLVETQK